MVEILFGSEPFSVSDVYRGSDLSPEQQLREEMRAHGVEPPDAILFDGKIHRFDTERKGKRAGYYVAHADNIPAACFGDWSQHIQATWRADVGRTLTPIEQMQHSRFLAEAKRQRETEERQSQATAANVVEEIWNNATIASPEHGYLKGHKVEPHGARVTGDGRLIVPLYGKDLHLASLQYIGTDSAKRFHGSGKVSGCFWWLGDVYHPAGKNVYIAEGFATAAAIYQVTGDLTFVAYSAHNISDTVEAARHLHKDAVLVVVADNDKSGIGEACANQAAAKHGARVVVPPKLDGAPTDACDYMLAGHDLNELLCPKGNDWLVSASEFNKQPAPIKWLVKHWIPESSLTMVHGQPASGKSFITLDLCLRVASGMEEWNRCKVKKAPVVYLMGEGQHGMRKRVAAWCQNYGKDPGELWFSQAGCDLDTPEGLAKVRDAIVRLPVKPALIVVDTLHRFLAGDENSSQDAKKMIDACAQLMREFECAILLVHHTGVSTEAQLRARGSSSYRGALDVELNVAKDDKDVIRVQQLKQKDAEQAGDLWMQLEDLHITGWFDEDGEPVVGAYVVPTSKPEKEQKTDKKTEDSIRLLERAWFASGAEEIDDQPYISRSAFRAFLEQQQWTDAQVKNALRADESRRLIGGLLSSAVIEPRAHGWAVVEFALAAQMMLRKLGEA